VVRLVRGVIMKEESPFACDMAAIPLPEGVLRPRVSAAG